MDFVLAVLGLSYVIYFCDAKIINNSAAKNRRASEQIMVNEAFMEQKDVLLEMLELKLKEVRDKKKKKSSGKLDQAVMPEAGHDPARSAELQLTANGISAVGEIEGRLSFGRSGKSNLKLIASGISNIGKSNLDLGVENGNVYIPGFSNLFLGTNCVKHILGALDNTDKKIEGDSRRIVPGILSSDNAIENLANTETKAKNTDDKANANEAKDTKIARGSDKQGELKETEVKNNATNGKGNKTLINGTATQSTSVETTLSEKAVTNLTVANTEPTAIGAAVGNNGTTAS